VVLIVVAEFLSGLVVGKIANFIVAAAFGGKDHPCLVEVSVDIGRVAAESEQYNSVIQHLLLYSNVSYTKYTSYREHCGS
jgi:hypothetical protein